MNFRDHVFKIAGAAAGIITGLGIFGFIFGLIGGALIDQLFSSLRRKKKLKLFFSNPGNETSPELVEAAGAAAAWNKCSGDPLKTELLSKILQDFFPFAPGQCIEILSEADNVDFEALSVFFKQNADEPQLKNLENLLKKCAVLKGPEPSEKSPADYAVLGLGPEASPSEVKRVYHRLAAQFHPDGGGVLTDEQKHITEEAFKKIKDAYERINR